jgi:hypothetical protein
VGERGKRGGCHAVVVDTMAEDGEFIDICFANESVEVCGRLGG